MLTSLWIYAENWKQKCRWNVFKMSLLTLDQWAKKEIIWLQGNFTSWLVTIADYKLLWRQCDTAKQSDTYLFVQLEQYWLAGTMCRLTCRVVQGQGYIGQSILVSSNYLSWEFQKHWKNTYNADKPFLICIIRKPVKILPKVQIFEFSKTLGWYQIISMGIYLCLNLFLMPRPLTSSTMGIPGH